jgi:hypothetical protein
MDAPGFDAGDALMTGLVSQEARPVFVFQFSKN